MKILTAQQTSALEASTLQKRSLTELDLATEKGTILAQKISTDFPETSDFYVFCGNNKKGLIGLIVFQQLIKSKKKCSLFILNITESGDTLFTHAVGELDTAEVTVEYINNETNFPEITEHTIVIDAIQDQKIDPSRESLTSAMIKKINTLENTVISINTPSGLVYEGERASQPAVKATLTYTFGTPKLNLLLSDNYQFVGEWQTLPLQLDQEYLTQTETRYHYLDVVSMRNIRHKLDRPKFAQKRDFGHTLIVAGSRELIGAAVLNTKAALRSGSGSVTVYLPACGYEIVQSSVPEAIVICDANNEHISHIDLDLNKYSAVLIEPGSGENPETLSSFGNFLELCQIPIVLDTSALSLLSTNRDLLAKVPKNSIFVLHPHEFDRLVGESASSNLRLEKQINFSSRYEQIVVLQGAHTTVTLPEPTTLSGESGQVFFNSTGNPGMATAGSGEVLTGTIAGLVAQGLPTQNAALFGVFIHGLAGDKARSSYGEISMTAGDIIENLRL